MVWKLRLSPNGPLIGNDIWRIEWLRARWRHVRAAGESCGVWLHVFLIVTVYKCYGSWPHVAPGFNWQIYLSIQLKLLFVEIIHIKDVFDTILLPRKIYSLPYYTAPNDDSESRRVCFIVVVRHSLNRHQWSVFCHCCGQNRTCKKLSENSLNFCHFDTVVAGRRTENITGNCNVQLLF